MFFFVHSHLSAIWRCLRFKMELILVWFFTHYRLVSSGICLLSGLLVYWLVRLSYRSSIYLKKLPSAVFRWFVLGLAPSNATHTFHILSVTIHLAKNATMNLPFHLLCREATSTKIAFSVRLSDFFSVCVQLCGLLYDSTGCSWIRWLIDYRHVT